METELKTVEAKNSYGLSRKTNIAIAAIGGLSMVQTSIYAIAAITIIALTAGVLQFIIDYRKVK